MKIEKFKVLLYLKKSGTDKSGKAPIMGRITVNRTMAQFGCKLSCRLELWNARESRLDGKSREAVETNAKLDKLLLWKCHATLTLLAKQDLPTFGYNMIDPLKSWCWGSILFYPFKISRFS